MSAHVLLNLLNELGKRDKNARLAKIDHRGSYMRSHVLLNLLNELGKRDKMRGLPRLIIEDLT